MTLGDFWQLSAQQAPCHGRSWRIGLALVPMVAGCSLLFSEVPKQDSGSQAFEVRSIEIAQSYSGPVPRLIPDAAALYEGVGSHEGAPAILLLRGALFPLDLDVWLELVACPSAAPAITALRTTISADRSMAVVLLQASIAPEFETECIAKVHVAGSGIDEYDDTTSTVLKTSVVLMGLPEFTDPAGLVDSDTLAPLYSEIVIPQLLQINGQAPAVLRSTSTLRISAGISVNAAGDQAGPGGCDGNREQEPSPCEHNGGNATDTTNGGGGGGHGTAGGGITRGSTFGDPFFAQDLSGGGGGGLGGATEPIARAMGGGGGGSLLLYARGVVDLTGASLSANGANGAAASPGQGQASGGGGGAGGGILVRSPVKVIHGSGLAASGAPGGIGAEGGFAGGKGGEGRIRLDTPNSAATPMSIPTAIIGPTLIPPEQVIVPVQRIILQLSGQGVVPDVILSVNGHADSPQEVSFSSGSASMLADLEPGINQVCVYPLSAIGPTSEVAKSCIELAYLPQ